MARVLTAMSDRARLAAGRLSTRRMTAMLMLTWLIASNPATGAGYALAACQLRPDVTAGGHRTATAPDGTCR